MHSNYGLSSTHLTRARALCTYTCIFTYIFSTRTRQAGEVWGEAFKACDTLPLPTYMHTYIRTYIQTYIHTCRRIHPPYLPFCVFSAKKSRTPSFSRLYMLLGTSFRHLGCKEYCTMFVPVSRCHLRNCVCCVMVLPVFVTYVPESALITADRATADVDETLVHVAYMHICGRGSGVTCLCRRDLLRLKSQHCRLNTDQGVKVITRTTTISSSFD